MATAVALASVAAAGGCGGSTPQQPKPAPTIATAKTAPPATTQVHTTPRPRAPARPHPPFAVGERVVTYVDRSRTVQFPGSAPEPRRLVTVIRYPVIGSPSGTDVQGAAPERTAGPFPLVIFGHGFAETPGPYSSLLQAWARAGYVVAAPVFPLENANAPGGPNENDLGNQPRDMRFVISRLLTAGRNSQSFLNGLVDPRRVAVTGQSDGGETALAVAYDSYYIDRRVGAAVILSGAKIPGVGGFDFPPPSPPLLATQGTADTINPPSFTSAFFDTAPAPKYLLTMFGASHLGPYTDAQPQLGIVERVTIAFLDHYLKGIAGALHRMMAEGDVQGLASVTGTP